jgi:hypothetical protein
MNKQVGTEWYKSISPSDWDIKNLDHEFNFYKCPVCDGKRKVPLGFYSYPQDQCLSFPAAPDTCRYCRGQGSIWK